MTRRRQRGRSEAPACRVPQAALTRAQYAVASVAALLVFLAVYAAFVALVLAQRLAPCAPLVAPKAVLADAASEYALLIRSAIT